MKSWLRQVTATCYCGKASAKRRCGAAQWSCTRLCGRVLSCGHRCPQKCHPGDCGPCKLTGGPPHGNAITIRVYTYYVAL